MKKASTFQLSTSMRPESEAGESASPSTPAVVPATGSAALPTRVPVVPGQRWHAYQIGDSIPCDDGWKFPSVNVGELEDVLIHLRPIAENPAPRSEAWEKLQKGKHPGLLRVIEAIEEENWRFEIHQAPPALTLREWGATHQAGIEDVETLVRQLGATIHALHADGLVHGNLNLDTIYLPSVETGLRVFIGGLDHATLYAQPGLVPLPVDPFFAPPEAAGLSKHNPGLELRAWDWWSLGRILQELVLGKPVLSLVLDRDISRMTPDIEERAEALLLERDGSAVRAGAVEKMPAIDDRLRSLLRGLLASARDARWGWEEVQEWLRRENVRARYELTRNERLFRWKDRPFDVQEAAAFFSVEANWVEGVGHIFDLKNEGSFVAFVTREHGQIEVREQLDALRDFMQLPAWREFSVEVVRTVIAAASWLQIGAERKPLLVRGHRVDAKYVRLLLSADGPPDGLSLVRAMLTAPFVQLITSRDADTARFLSVLASSSSDAIAAAEKQNWLLPEDEAGRARLITLALENEAELAARREELARKYAGARNPAVEAIFKAQKPKLRELILMSFAAGSPERFGFVTHLDWNRERYGVLCERGKNLAAAIFWRDLGRALKMGPLVFARWPWVIVVWGLLAAVLAWVGDQPQSLLLGLGVAAVLLALRVAACAWQRRGVQKYSKTGDAWTLRSQAERCRAEAVAVLPGETGKPVSALIDELAAINQEIAGLKLDRISPPSRSELTSAGALCSWLVVGAAGIFAQWQPEISAAAYASARAEAAAVAAENAEASGVSGTPTRPALLLTPEERFFTDPRLVYVPWNFPEPVRAPALPVRGYVKPTAEQTAMALIDARKLLAPFPPQGAKGVIAVPAMTSRGEAGLMLYDVKSKRLLDRRIYRLDQLPADSRVWYEVDQRKVLYLGEPETVNLEIWSVDVTDAVAR